jgi:hypothetical protein
MEEKKEYLRTATIELFKFGTVAVEGLVLDISKHTL